MASSADILRDLHADLHRRYGRYADEVENTWRRLSTTEREIKLRAGHLGHMLESCDDNSLGSLYLIIPEWNRQDLARGPADNLINILRGRATRSLPELYMSCAESNSPGDGDFIIRMVENHGLRHKDTFRNCWTFFIDLRDTQSPQNTGGVGSYGSSIPIESGHTDTLTRLDPLVKSKLIIPQRIGELVIMRQTMIAQSLLILIDNILRAANPTPPRQPPPPTGRKHHPGEPTVAATPTRAAAEFAPFVKDLIAAVDDRATASRDYYDLLRAEPVVLAHAFNIHFYSRPDLLPDELGRTLSAHTDKHIPGVFVDVIKRAARAEAVWRHLAGLLRLFESSAEASRATAAQHIANICHGEYIATQAWLGRQLSMSNTLRSSFRRTVRPDGMGRYKLVLRKDAESSSTTTTHDRFLLRLSKPTTLCHQAVPIIAAIDSLPPMASDDSAGGIGAALSDLAEIVWLVQGLTAAASLPAFTRHRCQDVPSSLAAVDAELDTLRDTLDIADFITSANAPLTTDGHRGALDRLDVKVAQKGGYDITARYNVAIGHALEELATAISSPATPREPMTTQNDGGNDTSTVTQPSISTKQKQKTRPSTVAPQPPPTIRKPTTLSMPACVHSASAATVATMTTMLRQSRVLSWASFELAMADIGFTIMPRGGSVFTYAPPALMAEHGSITLHRPHGAKLEGFRVLQLSHRLRAKYGWTGDSFTVRR